MRGQGESLTSEAYVEGPVPAQKVFNLMVKWIKPQVKLDAV